MDQPQKNKPRILFLFSDTGGGHRSAMEAIIEALFLEYGEQFIIETVDIFRDYAPRPLNFMPEWYPSIVKVPQAWGFGYKITNGHRRARLIAASAWPYVRRSIRKLVAQHPSDLIVSVHPLANAPTLHALGKERPPFITVVTDLVSGHALWYHRRADLCVVPTDAARQRALHDGLRPEQVCLVGLPVADRFCKPPGDPNAQRQHLGWPQDRPIILLVGGGDGMGPIEKTARSIAQGGLNAALVVVAGRNQSLKTRLEAMYWPIPTLIYGFTKEMPDFMRAADILVTKAGPGTISEALNAGLPMILYSRLPGQEDGNISYVESEGAGVWAPNPEKIVATLRSWIKHPPERGRAADACRRLANPQAARQIAHILAEYVGIHCQTLA